MLAEYNKQIGIGFGGGLLLFILGMGLSSVIFPLVAFFFWLYGCRSLARAKGYNGAIGLLLGLTVIFGVLILLVFPDRKK